MDDPQGATIKISKNLRRDLKILVARDSYPNYNQLIRELISKYGGLKETI